MDAASILRLPVKVIRQVYSQFALPFYETKDGFVGRVAEIISGSRQYPLSDVQLDTLRFPAAAIDPYNASQVLRVISFLQRNKSIAEAVASSLADDASRELLARLFAYRALGPGYIKLPLCNPDYWAMRGSAKALRIGKSPHSFPPFPMDWYRVTAFGEEITLQCWELNVVATFLERQYWFSRDGIEIQPEPGDVVIDAGACFGDTVLAFAAAVGPKGVVIGFEPMPRQLALLTENLDANPNLAKRITIEPYATSDRDGDHLVFEDCGASARPGKGGVPIETATIDQTVQRKNLRRVDFIKMDVEGSEGASLKGAAGTIRAFAPKLAISIYHRLEDLIDLPRLVRDIDPRYELYIEHHTVHSEETVLYARIP